MSSDIRNLAFSCFTLLLLQDLLQKDGYAEGEWCQLFSILIKLISPISVVTRRPITLDNIHSDIRSKPLQMTVDLLALLQVKIKPEVTSTVADKAHRTFHVNLLQQVQELILHLLKSQRTHCCHLDFAGGKMCDCYRILMALCADYQEYFYLMQITNNRCLRCELLPTDLGKGPQNLDCQDRDYNKNAIFLYQVHDKICECLEHSHTIVDYLYN